jgi:hypothetical protein
MKVWAIKSIPEMTMRNVRAFIDAKLLSSGSTPASCSTKVAVTECTEFAFNSYYLATRIAEHINAAIIAFTTITGICALLYFCDIRKKFTAIPIHVSALTRHSMDEVLTMPSIVMMEETSIKEVALVAYMTEASFKKTMLMSINWMR